MEKNYTTRIYITQHDVSKIDVSASEGHCPASSSVAEAYWLRLPSL
jgi:hypothetical protein